MHTRHVCSLKIVQIAFKIVLFLSGVKLVVKGLENVPKDQAVLYVGNHRGFFDIVTSYTLVPNLTGFVSKKEVKKVPFLNIWMMLVNCLFIDRDNVREAMKTILEGIKRLKNGISIFIFPEGTRSIDGTMAPFKEGSLKMATKAGVPIQPVAFFGTSAILEDHFPRIRKGTVTVQFAKPVYHEQLEKDDQKHVGAYTQKIIQKMLDDGPSV